MQKLLSLFLLLFFAITAMAQTAFELAGQTIVPPKNACQLRRGKKKAISALREPINDKYYLIAQFKEIPSQEEREKLTNSGAVLRDYIAENTYYITVPANAVSKCVKGTGIVSLMPIEWQWKVSSLLLANEIPDFALKGGRVGIVIYYQEEFTPAWVAERLHEMGIAEPAHISGAPFYSFELWLPQQQIETLAKEQWVKVVRMVSPPAVLY